MLDKDKFYLELRGTKRYLDWPLEELEKLKKGEFIEERIEGS